MTELTCKLQEINRLEEEQRHKVKEISDERDRIYRIRDQLLEEIASKTVECDELTLQLQVNLLLLLLSSLIF